MRKKLLLTLTAALFVNLLWAQMKEWKWADYKMQFQAPSDISVKENSGTKFSGGNDHIWLTVYPKKGEALSYDRMKAALETWAKSSNVRYNSADVGYMSNLNRYWGYYIDGTGDNGLPTSLLLIVDPEYTDYSFYVWLQYQKDYLNTAVDILKSFKPM